MPRHKSFDESTIVAKARDVFWLKGYEGTSISDLESATGLKRSSLYASFGDKRSLYLQTLRSYHQDSMDSMTSSISMASNSIDTLYRMIQSSLTQACADPQRKGCYINQTMGQYRQGCSESRAILQQSRAQVIDQFDQMIARDAAGGHLDLTSRRNLAAYIYTLQSGLMTAVRADTPLDQILHTFDLGWQVVVDRLRPQQ